MNLGDIINGDEVVGLLRSEVYCFFYEVPSEGHPWDEAHPGWRDADMVMIKLAEPRTPFTFQEFLGMQKESLSLEVAQQRYDKQPKARNMWVPSVALS